MPETPIDLPKLRQQVGSRLHPLTQEAFAKRFGFTAAAVRDWEQGRRQPSRSARLLLAMIEREPKAVQRVLDAL